MQNASLVLLVEGSDDAKALQSIIAHRSAKIREYLKNGEVTFDDLGGASALSQKASFYQSSACQIQCFLDDDKAGKLAVEKALNSKSLKISDVNLCVVPGRGESELEDIYDVNVYREAFRKEFGVDPKAKTKAKKGKWSDSIQVRFKEAGKPWNDRIKQSAKNWLSDFAFDNPATIIKSELEKPLDNFILSAEAKLN